MKALECLRGALTWVALLVTTGCFPSFDGLSDDMGSRDAASEPNPRITVAAMDAALDLESASSSELDVVDSGNPPDTDTTTADADRFPPPRLLVKYDFDQTTGVVVPDSSGNERHGKLEGGGTWMTGRLGNALQLDGASGFVTLPVGIIGQRAELTFAMWIRLDAVAVWQRIFDFGKDSSTYMFMTATDPSGKVRFAISVAGINGEARIVSASGLSVGTWKHVALVLTASSAALYIDGVSETLARNLALSPPVLGLTQNDWIGRSQYMADSYLKGAIDDFRIYEGALSDAAVFALAHPGT